MRHWSRSSTFLGLSTVDLTAYLIYPEYCRAKRFTGRAQLMENVWHLRRVADNASKACWICFKPTTSVLITPNNKDFFFICSGHLVDKGFCQPDPDEAAAVEAKKKKDELDAEMEKVKKEYDEKQKLKREKRKAKEKEKDKAKEKEAESKEEEEDTKDEKAKNDKVCNVNAMSIQPRLTVFSDQGAFEDERRCSSRSWPPHISPPQVSAT